MQSVDATRTSENGTSDGARTYVLALLTVVSFFNYLDRMVIAILLQPIKHELRLSDSQMGLITGLAFAVLYASLGLPLARIADRRSRVALISACLAIWSAVTALTGLVRNFAELFFVRMAVGIGEGRLRPGGAFASRRSVSPRASGLRHQHVSGGRGARAKRLGWPWPVSSLSVGVGARP